MGFRFRRSVRIIPGIRLNFSKSGISTSIGGRGATINFSKRGTKTTVGLPGTGLSYSTMATKDRSFPHPVQTTDAEHTRSQVNGCFTLLVIGLVVALVVSIKGIVSSDPAAVQAPKAQAEVEKLYVTASHLNCRVAPNKSSRRIIQLTRGQTVHLASNKRHDGWVQVYVDGQTCWGFEAYLMENKS